MKISRQKIYKSHFLLSYIKSLSFFNVATSKTKLINFFIMKFGSPPIFIGRARFGINLACLFAIQSTGKKKCIMSPLTILDLANMVRNTGAEIEFYDFERKTLQIDIVSLEKIFAKGSVASLIVTHYYGADPRIEDLVLLCKKYSVILIEDCAISIGSYSKGKSVGSFGDISVFSFSLFKFLNFFWGGSIICKNKDAYDYIDKKVAKYKSLSIYEYFPQFIKFIKFGLVTTKPIYSLFFYFFRFGLKHNIKFIKNNIQNDPFLLYTGVVESSCYSVPHNSFYIELSSKIANVFYELEERRIKSQYLFTKFSDLNINLLKPGFSINDSSLINYPLIFESEKIRDEMAAYLLEKGIDCSKQLYRNIHNVEGYKQIKGNTDNINETIPLLLFLPIHRGINFTEIVKVADFVCDFFEVQSRY